MTPPPVISDSFFGDAWNKMRDAARAQQPIAAPGILTGHTIHGTSREAEAAPIAYGREDTSIPDNMMFRLKSVQANYLTCRSWDGTTEGSQDILIARLPQTRSPASEVIADQLWSYAYSVGADSLNAYRLATGPTGIQEQQVVIPYWRPDEVLFAIQCRHTGVLDSGNVELTWLHLSAQCWAQRVV